MSRKPWEEPLIYEETTPAVVSQQADGDEPEHRRERTAEPAENSRKFARERGEVGTFQSTDTEPMVYRRGNRRSVFDLDRGEISTREKIEEAKDEPEAAEEVEQNLDNLED